jgi:hypothetical protein
LKYFYHNRVWEILQPQPQEPILQPLQKLHDNYSKRISACNENFVTTSELRVVIAVIAGLGPGRRGLF